MKIELKKLRKQTGLTQAELAAKIDVNVRTIQRWENGEISIPLCSMIAIKHILKGDSNG